MIIDSSTDLYGIFGHPIKHSYSPAMHNAAFNKLNLNCVYLAFDIPPENLEFAVESIKQLSVKGINVTIPHKQQIMNYLDEISDEARYTGAVNTIKNTQGRLYGHNTDVGGFLKALEIELGVSEFTEMSAVLIGAGGAARAVLSALCIKGIRSINIFNRTVEKASNLSEYFSSKFDNVSIDYYDLNDNSMLEKSLGSSQIVINSSSAGMAGHDALNIPLDKLEQSSYVYDLVYNPRNTELVKKALSLGHRAASGLGMLLYQGAESFQIWTGQNAPVEVMQDAMGNNS